VRPVEACEAALGEAARVADLDEQLGDRPRRQAAELAQRAVVGAHERLELRDGGLLVAVKLRDPCAMGVQ
jgi:hypothetical protein